MRTPPREDPGWSGIDEAIHRLYSENPGFREHEAEVAYMLTDFHLEDRLEEARRLGEETSRRWQKSPTTRKTTIEELQRRIEETTQTGKQSWRSMMTVRIMEILLDRVERGLETGSDVDEMFWRERDRAALLCERFAVESKGLDEDSVEALRKRYDSEIRGLWGAEKLRR